LDLNDKQIRLDITPMTVFYTIRAAVTLLFVLMLIVLLSFPVWLITVLFDKRQRLYLFLTRFFIRLFFLLNCIVIDRKINYNGLQPPENGRRRIYALNHASIVDGFLLFLLPGDIKFMAKDTYSKIPIFGLGVSMTGSVTVKEGGQGTQLDMYYGASDILDAGYPLAIFPEGTRSRTGKIERLQNSAFMLAKEKNAEIIPVVLDTWNVIRPGAFWVRTTDITINILPAIGPEEYDTMTYKELSNLVKYRMIEEFVRITDKKKLSKSNYYRNNSNFQRIDSKIKKEMADLRALLKLDA